MNQQFPFYLMIVSFIIFTLIVSLTVKEKNITQESSGKKVKEKWNLFDVVKNKNAMVLFIGAFFVIFNMGLLMAYWIPYFEKVNGFSSSEISFALMITSIVGLSSLFVGVLCDKFDKKKILILAIVLQIIGFIIAMFISNLAMLWIFAVIFGLGFTLTFVVVYSIIPYIVDRRKLGEYMGIFNIFIGLSGVIANPLGGYIVGSQYVRFLFPTCIVFAVIGLLVIVIGKLKLNSIS